MKKLIICLTVAVFCFQAAVAQKKIDREAIKQARADAREEITILKKQIQANPFQPLAAPTPNPFNDTDSFGQNVLFLGSLYAGTVYVYHSCDPQVLLDELGLSLAGDDHCVVKNPGTGTGSQTIFDNVWQITIPKNTVQNVIYPMLNNGVEYDNFGITTGGATLFYSPRITIVSDALNDPAALDPTTGLPMNGSFTTSLAGSTVKFLNLAGGETDIQNYASVGGRGLSRAYFRSIGLPDNVINKLFKKEMTLKFGIRVNVNGAIDFGQFFYTFRLIGQ